MKTSSLTLEEDGFWWSPTQPERKYYGSLTFKPTEGGLLCLKASDISFEKSQSTIKKKIIHGKTTNGQLVSLLDCEGLPSGWSSAEIVDREIYTALIIKDYHVPSDNKWKLHNVNVKFAFIDKWIEVTGLKLLHTKDTPGLEVQYRHPDPINLKIDDQLTICLAIGIKALNFPSYCNRKIHLEEDFQILIDSTKPEPFKFYRNLIQTIQDFFTIALLRPTNPEYVGANFDPRSHHEPLPSQLLFPNPSYIMTILLNLIPKAFFLDLVM